VELTEFEEILDKRICALVDTKGVLIPAEAALDLAAVLREEFPRDTKAWLDTRLPHLLQDMLRQQIHNDRASAGRAQFSRAAALAEGGQPKALQQRLLDTKYVINGDYGQKSLGQLDREELKYVANDYTRRSQSNANRAAFFNALAKKVPIGKTVGDVYGEDVLRELYVKFVD